MIPRQLARTVVVATLTGIGLAGCGQHPHEDGPLTFGVPGHEDPENEMCIPRSYLDGGLLVGDLATNDSDQPVTLTGLSLVDPKGVSAAGVGAVIIPEGAMGFYARPLGEPVAQDEVPTPELAPEMPALEVGPGERAEVAVQVTAAGDVDPAGAKRLALTYEHDGQRYTEWSNVSFRLGAPEDPGAGCD